MEDNTIAGRAREQNSSISDLIVQNPSIKITRNTKGYNFEFKILSSDLTEMDRLRNEIVKRIYLWEVEEREVTNKILLKGKNDSPK